MVGTGAGRTDRCCFGASGELPGSRFLGQDEMGILVLARRRKTKVGPANDGLANELNCLGVNQFAIWRKTGPGGDSSIQEFCLCTGTQWQRWRTQRCESHGYIIENGEKSVNFFVLQVAHPLKSRHRTRPEHVLNHPPEPNEAVGFDQSDI